MVNLNLHLFVVIDILIIYFILTRILLFVLRFKVFPRITVLNFFFQEVYRQSDIVDSQTFSQKRDFSKTFHGLRRKTSNKNSFKGTRRFGSCHTKVLNNGAFTGDGKAVEIQESGSKTIILVPGRNLVRHTILI